MHIFREARWWLRVLVLLWGSHYHVVAQIEFAPPLLRSNQVTLSLRGAAGSSYAIESSIDLATWTEVFSGMAEDGTVEVEVPVEGGRRFYRGRPEGEPVADQTIDIKPVLDPERFAKLVLIEDEGKTRLYPEDGAEIMLRFPTNAVADVAVVTMTLVTNITGLPLSGPLLGAVQISFDDELLLGAAAVDFTLGTNVPDRRKVVSFTAGPEGKDFYLTPNRIVGSVVSIPVTSSGIYGVCLATTEEVAALEQTLSSPAPAGLGAGLLHAQSILGTSRLCFPKHVERALTVRNRMARAMRKVRTKLMVKLTASRQAALAGTSEDSSEVLAEVGRISCDFYNEHIAPRWNEAKQNCPLMSVLLQFSLNMERQLQLLGVPDEERCTAKVISPERLCPGFKACLEEIRLCCMGGHPGRERLRDMAGMIRQQELLGISGQAGLGCFDWGDAIVDEVVEVCTPHVWKGSVRIKEKGKFEERTDAPNGFREVLQKYEMTYHGFVTAASEINQGPAGLIVNLTFQGPLQSSELDDEYDEVHNRCGTSISHDVTVGSVIENVIYKMNLFVRTNGQYTLSLGYVGLDERFTPAVGEEVDRSTRTSPSDINCNTHTATYSRTHELPFQGPALFSYSATSPNINAVIGRTNMVGRISDPPTKIEFTWSLKREVKPQ